MSRRFRISASGVATATAVVAIALGIIDSMQTRAHNRLSVVPYVVVDYTIIGRSDHSIYSITVSNEGVGPAIVRAIAIALPEGLGGGSYTDWREVVDRLRQRGAQVPNYWNFEPGQAIGVQRSTELLRVQLPEALAGELLPLLADIDIVVTYASVYREEFTARLD